MLWQKRLLAAVQAAGVHVVCSLFIAAWAAGLVFGLWYPPPFQELASGRELFLLVVSVDVVCGPLLTLVLFNPSKPKAELWRDLTTVAVIQLAALGYGLFTVWQARPLYLVQEVDRFKVIARPDLIQEELNALPENLHVGIWSSPKTVAIRKPKSIEEKNQVLFDALRGGRDFAERPDFYRPYEGDDALQALKWKKPLAPFLTKFPDQMTKARQISIEAKKELDQLFYLPVTSRQDWVAILDDRARVIGYLEGNGF